MQLIVSNLSSPIRRETMWERTYIVANATLIVPGVLSGSEGSLLYPPAEIRKNYSDWDGMPILRNHPDRASGSSSGRTPAVYAAQGMGYVFNTTVGDGGRLKSELWFDEERLKRLDNKLYQRVLKGEKIELSTGLYTDNEPAHNGANHNGKPYTHIAKNYRPDHLAVLPNQVGACSLADGCGVHNAAIKVVNCDSTKKPGPCPTSAAEAQQASDLKSKSVIAKKGGLVTSPASIIAQRAGSAGAAASMTPEIIGARATDKSKGAKIMSKKVSTKNETSYDELREKLSQAIRERYGFVGMFDSPTSTGLWVQDVFEDHFVYSYNSKSYKLGYKANLDTGDVTISQDVPQKVERTTVYVPTKNKKIKAKKIKKVCENCRGTHKPGPCPRSGGTPGDAKSADAMRHSASAAGSLADRHSQALRGTGGIFAGRKNRDAHAQAADLHKKAAESHIAAIQSMKKSGFSDARIAQHESLRKSHEKKASDHARKASKSFVNKIIGNSTVHNCDGSNTCTACAEKKAKMNPPVLVGGTIKVTKDGKAKVVKGSKVMDDSPTANCGGKGGKPGPCSQATQDFGRKLGMDAYKGSKGITFSGKTSKGKTITSVSAFHDIRTKTPSGTLTAIQGRAEQSGIALSQPKLTMRGYRVSTPEIAGVRHHFDIKGPTAVKAPKFKATRNQDVKFCFNCQATHKPGPCKIGGGAGGMDHSFLERSAGFAKAASAKAKTSQEHSHAQSLHEIAATHFEKAAKDLSLSRRQSKEYELRAEGHRSKASVHKGRAAMAKNQSSGQSVGTGEKEVRMNRDQAVQWLVANCDVWKSEKSKAALNSMEDEAIMSLVEQQQRLTSVFNQLESPIDLGDSTLQLAFNDDGELEAHYVENDDDEEENDDVEEAAEEGFDDDEEEGEEEETPAHNAAGRRSLLANVGVNGKKVRNAKKGADDEMEMMDSDEEDEQEYEPKKGKMKTNAVKPQTTQEWLNSAPEPIRNAVHNAMDIEKAAKAELVDQLVVNCSKEKAPAMRKSLLNKSLRELRELRELMPKENPTANKNVIRDVTDYFGNAGPAMNSSQVDNEESEEDALGLPTGPAYNYAVSPKK